MLLQQGWGKTIVLGSDKPGSKLSLSCSEILVSGKSLVGCMFGGLKPKSHVPILIKRYLDKVLCPIFCKINKTDIIPSFQDAFV